MAICSCNITLGGTGKGKCEPIQDVLANLFAVRTFDDSGVKNSIGVGDTVDSTYLTGKLNEADGSKRWYPLRQQKQVVDERAEAITETIDNVDYNTDKGVRTYSGAVIKADTVFLDNISGLECGAWSFFGIDKSNRIIGQVSIDGTELYPLPSEEGTVNTNLVKTSVGVIQKVLLTFTYSTLLRDEDLRLMESTADLVNAQGLLDVNAAISSESTTGFVADLTTDYGYFGDPIKVVGWVLADFALYNETQASAVVITSVTEAPDGTYTFVTPAQTSSDVLTLTDTKDGFELSQTINIP